MAVRSQLYELSPSSPPSGLRRPYGTSRLQAYLMHTSSHPSQQRLELSGNFARLRTKADSGGVLGESSAAPLYSLAAMEAKHEDAVVLEADLDSKRRETLSRIYGFSASSSLRAALDASRPARHLGRLRSHHESGWSDMPPRRPAEAYAHLSAQAAASAARRTEARAQWDAASRARRHATSDGGVHTSAMPRPMSAPDLPDRTQHQEQQKQ